jgi:hypothetical protein
MIVGSGRHGWERWARLPGFQCLHLVLLSYRRHSEALGSSGVEKGEFRFDFRVRFDAHSSFYFIR